ncbi:MAG: DUF4815 domain-containing protein [Chloroflexus sp.]
MRGDFTRWTFNRHKHYTGVLNQQGRVALDADWNEQIAIEHDDARTGRADMIGLCGGPQGQAGFEIVVSSSGLQVTSGRYYVAGIRVENEQTVAITAQPDLPVTSLAQVAGLAVDATLPAGIYLAYLDVWERHITALEDPAIREVALGGPDTTTRLQVMAQVRLLHVGDVGMPLNCATANAAWEALLAGSSGQLEARTVPSDQATSPCIVPAQAGYSGLENQLYRVEVHRVISATQIALKWSRENGSVVVGWNGQDVLNPNRLIVQSVGRDETLGLTPNHWVELTDDAREKRGESGVLVKIVQIDGHIVTIDPAGQTINYNAFGPNPKLRRWDMPATISNGAIIATTNATAWTELEHGVQIRLTAGSFRPGDYWLIPARAVTGDIEWPRAASGQPVPQQPRGTRHTYCKLALLEFNNGSWSKRSDCRHLFPPLTEMIRFYAVGGDGQETLPGDMLPQPLQVAVMNGQQPVNNARVRFRLVPETAAGLLSASGVTGQSIDVTTAISGIYSCAWQLGPTAQSQRVEAFLEAIDGKPLLDSTGQPLIPRVFFNANLSRASQVAYEPHPDTCPDLAAARTVQAALDILCRRPRGSGCCVTIGETGVFPNLDTAIKELLARGERHLCLCLLPGVHESSGLRLELSPTASPLHIEVKGCGNATNLRLSGPFVLQGIDSITLRELAINVTFVPSDGGAAITCARCPQVTITDCTITGLSAAGQITEQSFRPGGALIAITDSDTVQISHNTIAVATPQYTFEPIRELFNKLEIASLNELFTDDQRTVDSEWRGLALQVAEDVAALDRERRSEIARALQDINLRSTFSAGETLQFFKLILALTAADPRFEVIFDLLFDLRLAAVKARPGTALMLHQRRSFANQQLTTMAELLDEADTIMLDQNRIAGEVSLYGLPAPFNASTPQIAALQSLKRREESRIAIAFALLGTIHIRSNHLTRLTIGFELLTELQRTAATQDIVNLSSDVCTRLIIDGNIFEGVASLILSRQLIIQANIFTAMAALPNTRSSSVAVGTGSSLVGVCLSDVTTMTGNQGANLDDQLINIARLTALAANAQIQII